MIRLHRRQPWGFMCCDPQILGWGHKIILYIIIDENTFQCGDYSLKIE